MMSGKAKPLLQPDPSSLLTSREPLITTIIPLFNGADFIEAAIRSVLGQTLTPDEIVVVDVGSTDHGPEIVDRLPNVFPISLIRQQISSHSTACSAGVEQAHGDLLSFLNQEDIWYPAHLAELVAPFRLSRAHKIGLSYSDVDEVSPAGQMVCREVLTRTKTTHVKSTDLERNLLSSSLLDPFIPLSAIVISRAAFQAVGGFDEPRPDDEDNDLSLRLRRAGFHTVFHPSSLLRSHNIRSANGDRLFSSFKSVGADRPPILFASLKAAQSEPFSAGTAWRLGVRAPKR